MIQDLKITLVQADQIWEDKMANFQQYDEMLEQVTDTNLILLPEMFQTGFSMNTKLAEDFKTSSSIQWLKEKAKKHQAAFYTSLMIQEEGKMYNRGVFVFPNGDLEHYDKRKTFTLAMEHEYFDHGHTNKIVDYLGWKIQLSICYDLRFPEILRNHWNPTNASSTYDVLLIVANWPAKRGEHWRTLLKARAIENQCFVVGVNRIGKDQNDLNYSGDSYVFNMLGEIESEISTKSTTISCAINHVKQQEMRQILPFLQDQSLN